MPALPTTSEDLSPVPATNGNMAAEPEQPAQDRGSPDDGQLHIDVGASTSEGQVDLSGPVLVANGLDRRESRSSAEDSPAQKTAVRWVGPPDGSILAKLEAPDGTQYAVSKRRVVIGRESTHSETDMVVQENNYVSRGHLVLSCREDGIWTVVCNGKNGVFVNSHLVKKGAEPTPVPKMCSLRFPSTSVRVGFQSLTQVASDAPMPTRTAIEQGAAAVKTANASRDSGFVSPSDLVSPVRAVISPSSGARNNNNNKSLTLSASPAAKSASGELSDGDDADGGAYDGKPPYSYAQLIVQAIASTVDKQMTLSGIYAFITKTYPWYRTSDKGWQNSIRHNLSLNRYFIKVPRSQEEPGKGSFWRLDPGSEGKLLQFAFKKRRQRGGGKGVRSAPVSPGLEGSKSDGELHDIFPGDASDSARLNAGVTSGLPNNSNNHHQQQLAIPNDPKPSIARPASLGSRIDGAMVRPNDFHSVVRSAGTPDTIGRSPTSHLPSEASTPRIMSAKDGKAVFRFSPIETNVAAGSSRYIQSAPCSPKGFGKDGFPKREHHHSGGPFRVRTSAKDGRHRLQLCHSPPEYVPVTRADMSALQMLTQGRNSSKTLLQHYRGGSQSLSTTPVREILAGGPRMHQLLAQDGERIAKALLDASPEPKVLKRRVQENGHHHAQHQQTSQQHSSSAADSSVFVQPLRAMPAAPTATLGRPDLLHLQQQQHAAAQQALAAQVYSNQLAAAAYLNPMLPAWAHAQQNAAAAAGLYPPGSFLSIGGAGRFSLLGAGGQGLLGLDSARLLATLGGNVGGPSVPKIARTE